MGTMLAGLMSFYAVKKQSCKALLQIFDKQYWLCWWKTYHRSLHHGQSYYKIKELQAVDCRMDNKQLVNYHQASKLPVENLSLILFKGMFSLCTLVIWIWSTQRVSVCYTDMWTAPNAYPMCSYWPCLFSLVLDAWKCEAFEGRLDVFLLLSYHSLITADICSGRQSLTPCPLSSDMCELRHSSLQYWVLWGLGLEPTSHSSNMKHFLRNLWVCMLKVSITKSGAPSCSYF